MFTRMVSSYLALKTFDVLQGVLKDTRFGVRPGPAVRHATQPIAMSSAVPRRTNGAQVAATDLPCEIIDFSECRERKLAASGHLPQPTTRDL